MSAAGNGESVSITSLVILCFSKPSNPPHMRLHFVESMTVVFHNGKFIPLRRSPWPRPLSSPRHTACSALATTEGSSQSCPLASSPPRLAATSRRRSHQASCGQHCRVYLTGSRKNLTSPRNVFLGFLDFFRFPQKKIRAEFRKNNSV